MATTQTLSNECKCGCGTLVRNRFAQGHDARFKGQLLRAARAGDKAAARAMVSEGWVKFLDAELVPAPRWTNRNSKGRFAASVHIDAFAWDDELNGFWTDGTMSHAHPACSEIVGVTHNEAVASEWICGVCVHTNSSQVWS